MNVLFAIMSTRKHYDGLDLLRTVLVRGDRVTRYEVHSSRHPAKIKPFGRGEMPRPVLKCGASNPPYGLRPGSIEFYRNDLPCRQGTQPGNAKMLWQ